MPWRRARRKVERPVDVSRSIEESLEEAAEAEEEEDLVELAELDGARITEAATGQPDPDREPSDLAIKLQNALDAPHREPPRRGLESEAPHRGRLPQSAASVRETTRVKAAAPSESAHAAALPEVGVDLEVEAARGLRLKNPVLTASGTFGQGVEYAELIDVSRLGAIVKLTPNAPDVVAVARACEEAGADGLTAINTVLGMRIDTKRRRPILGTGSGGLSGPAIRPIAVHITYQVAQAVAIPIIGAGGVTNTDDALEFLMAGASAVQVGTATFADPLAPIKVIEGLAAYVGGHGLASIRDVIGVALPPPEPDD